ncbi:MAG: 4Fe-4S dicluster domain-containing protein [Gemmatimonadales bacterium]|nr:4Fe-4S dicluster domain-containing protein [Gemmatimonadales bacterium]
MTTAHVVGDVRGMSTAEHELRRAFLAEVESIPGGRRISRCLQCGTCTGSCPVSYAMDISPRELIARFRAGDIGTILRSRTIWLCASCYACTARCPVGIKITDIIYALKRMAMARGLRPSRYPVFALAESFVTVVKRYGRNNESRLMALYYSRAGILRALKHVGLALRLLRKGRLPLRARRIRGLEGLRKILRRAEALELQVQHEIAGATAPVGYGVVSGVPPRPGPVASARAAT